MYSTAVVLLISLASVLGQDLTTVATDFTVKPVGVSNASQFGTHDTPGQYVVKKATTDYDGKGKRLNSHVIFEYDKMPLVTQCALRCSYEPACRSFNFNKQLQKCQLNQQDDQTAGQDIVIDLSYDFVRKGTYQIPKVPF